MLILLVHVGISTHAGDAIETWEALLLMQFLAAGNVVFGLGPFNII